MGLMVGSGPLEAWQEAVVDIDAAPGEMRRLRVGEDLHVAGQHHQLRARLIGHGTDLRLLAFLRRGGHRQVVERHIADIGVADRFARMVGDDRHRIDRQFADAPAIEQVGEAMVELADHDHHPPPVAAHELPVHRQLARERQESSAEALGPSSERIELDPHEKPVRLAVVELLRFEDIAALLEQEARDPRGDPRPVGAGEGEDERFAHVTAGSAPLRFRASAGQ